jgi:nitrogen regulatory protein P-II 1
MKYVIAIIKPHRLESVKAELEKEDVHLMTVIDALGCGRQKGVTEVYRGVKEVDNLLRKIKIEIAVNDSFLERTIAAITRGARENEIGDGKIFVFDMENCIRIRTGEQGGDAIG